MKAVKFILILLITLLVLDQAISLIISYSHNETYTGQTGGKTNNLLKNYESVNMLALGNSRCAQHIIPSRLSENAYNLSHNGMSLIFHTGLVDQILESDQMQVDTLILHIEPYEAYSGDDSYIKDIQFLSYYYHQNSWITRKINEISRFESFKYLLKSYRWNGKLLSIMNNWNKSRAGNIPARGYTPTIYNPRDSLNLRKKSVKNGKKKIEKSVINKNFKSYIEHLKQLAASNNTQLRLFTSPTYIRDENSVETITLEKYFDSLEVTYLNYSKSEFDVVFESKNLWKDNFHLNNEGAEILTSLIKEDLKKAPTN